MGRIHNEPIRLIPLHELYPGSTDPKDEYRWVIDNENLVFEFKSDQGEYVIPIPYGTVTDLASTPRWAWGIISPQGYHLAASIVHDYLYSHNNNLGIDRKTADDIFLEAMIASNVPKWRRRVMYRGVRIWSKKYFHGRPVIVNPPGMRAVEIKLPQKQVAIRRES